MGCALCYKHRCPCGEEVDSKGHHGLSCKFSAGRRPRHAEANDIISRALKSAQVPAIKEPTGCSRDDGKKPDGLTLMLIPWKKGKCLVWDYTCADTYAASYIKSTSTKPGFAANTAETKKKSKYKALQDRFIIMPVAQETSGVWGDEALRFLKDVGQKITDSTNESRASHFLFQRMSVALQCSNVSSILGTLPPGKELSEIFYL